MSVNSPVKKAVIPVAGLGTRGLPFTKEVPKEMIPILDTPAIHFIVDEVISAGIEQIVLVSSRGKTSLEDYFDYSANLDTWLRRRGKELQADRLRELAEKCEIITVRQKQPLGLGHAVLCAESVVGNHPFVVCLADEIFPPWNPPGKASGLEGLITVAQTAQKSAIGVLKVPIQESKNYGMIEIPKGIDTESKTAKNSWPVLSCIEKPPPDKAPSPFAIIGRYVFEPLVFEKLKNSQAGANGEIQLTDAIDKLAREGRVQASLFDVARFDVGNHFQYLQAQIEMGLRRPEMADALRTYLKGRTHDL